MQSYKTETPNHVHQLTVTPSKRYWLTAGGVLKYQHKKMDVKLDKLSEAKKTPLVHYIIRDHYSGITYSEICSGNKLTPLTEFLSRAWKEKEHYQFCGVPEFITLPKTVEKVFPQAKAEISKLNVQFAKVTSGFQGGIRDVRTLEEFMKLCADRPVQKYLGSLGRFHLVFASDESRVKNLSKLELWVSQIRALNLPPEKWPDHYV